jgi:hypothetical protein
MSIRLDRRSAREVRDSFVVEQHDVVTSERRRELCGVEPVVTRTDTAARPSITPRSTSRTPSRPA